VSKSAGPDEIKKAYRKAAIKNHPDKGGDEAKVRRAPTPTPSVRHSPPFVRSSR
jgi:curved DNA-binding protein CbpA